MVNCTKLAGFQVLSFRSFTVYIFKTLCDNLTYNVGTTKFRWLTTMTGKVKIGTHDGSFQCDEALACSLLKMLPQYKDADIVRTRDQNILNTCDIVVDVGKEYNHSKRRYDHHMRDFKESLSTVIKKPGYDSKITLSASGLIYCHYGHDVIKLLVPHADSRTIDVLFKYIYENFVKEVDAIDNGVDICANPLYYIRTDISSRVKNLNPAWNSKGIDPDKQFLKAVELTGQEFTECVNSAANIWLPAKCIVEDAIAKRFEVDPSGEIIILQQFAPWCGHLFAIEKELNIQPLLKYVIYKSDNYRVQSIPIEPTSFTCRMFLPEAWAGLCDDELVRACGIEGAEFVHRNRFIGGSATRESALMMARKALELGKVI
ncbi:MYG1 protein C27H6.8 [Anthophora quadrimaculata]